jgi:hypothetical protein
VEEKMPVFLRDGPADLQQAWLLYQSVTAVQEKAFDGPAPGSTIASRRTSRPSGALSPDSCAGRASAGRPSPSVPFTSGRMVRHGQRILCVPGQGLLLAYLQLGRVDLALAAGGVLDGQFMGMKGRAFGSDSRLLAAAGIDWESYHWAGTFRPSRPRRTASPSRLREAARWLSPWACLRRGGRDAPEACSRLVAALGRSSSRVRTPRTLAHGARVSRASRRERSRSTPISGGVLDVLANAWGRPRAGAKRRRRHNSGGARPHGEPGRVPRDARIAL